MNGKVDRRILKSRNTIYSTFLKMLIEEKFDEITVKKIAEKADISRKTFYLHYVDKYDLLDRIVSRHMEELEQICREKRDKDFSEGTVIWFHYFEIHKAFFSALFKSESTVSFRKQLLDFVQNQLRVRIEASDQVQDPEILLRFLSTAVLGILEGFVLDQLSMSTEQVAEQVGKLLIHNLPSLSRG